MKTGSLLAAIFLALVAVGHILRLWFQINLVADGYTVPMWVSVPAVVVPALILYLLWRERRA